MWALLTFVDNEHTIEFFDNKNKAIDAFIAWIYEMKKHRGLMLTQYVVRGIATNYVQSSGANPEDYLEARLVQIEAGKKYNF